MSKIKTFRNIAVVSMATAVGLGVVGGVAGTVAWYQYSTRSTTSIIGTAVADTGVLQVSKTGADNTWKRDLITADLLAGRSAGAELTPVTFGALNADGSLPAKAYKDADASENAYAVNPGKYADVYKEASSDKDYIQYSFYLKAEKDGSKVALPVYLSDILLENYSVSNANFYKSLRVHLDVDDNNDGTSERYFLLSALGETIALYGQLDLDGDAKADIVGGYEGNANRDDVVVYGKEGDFQSALAVNDLKATRDGEGNFSTTKREKIVLNTKADAISKVTVTIWIEGWDHNIGEETIEVKENSYRVVKTLHGEDLAGKSLYIVDNDGKYVLQTSGRALADKTYYSLDPEVKIERATAADPEESVAGLYTLNGTTYEPASGNSLVGVRYYDLHAEEPAMLKKDAAATEDVHELFIHDGVNYVACDSDDDTANNYKLFKAANTYYELLTEEQYVVKAIADEDEYDAEKANLFVLNGVTNKYEAVGAAAYDNTATYYVLDQIEMDVPVWNGAASIVNQQFRFGLTFDVGADAFAS